MSVQFSASVLTASRSHAICFVCAAPPPSHYGGSENDPLLARVTWFRSNVGMTEVLYFLIFVVYLVFMVLQILFSPNETMDYLFIAAFAAQRIPIVGLVLVIVSNRQSDGPTWESKVFLSIAAGLNVLGDIPLVVWSRILPNNCVFAVASLVDLVHILFILSLVFFFLFLTREYRRNMEECIWSHVSQIQDSVGIGFKHF